MSDFDGDQFDGDLAPNEGERPAAPTSGLAGLRAQREKIKQDLHLDLRVPRYETLVYVRYSPVSAALAKRLSERAKKSNDADAAVNANAALLAESCLGVFEKDAHGEPIGDPEEWPKFDEHLAAYLGSPDVRRAADVVRLLFLTDGDVIATATRVTEWSGFAGGQVAEEYEGN